MLDIEQRAFRITLLSGGGKGVLYSLIPIIFIEGNPATKVIGGLFLGVGIGLLTEYLWYYRPNIEHHRLLLKRLGEPYEREFEQALEEIGLEKMLQRLWFVSRYKKTWTI